MSQELQHYGVLGMKWGVRRDRAYLDRGKNLTRKEKKTTTREKSL
jgi:hypothetical protein